MKVCEIPVTLYTRDEDVQRGSSFEYRPHVFWNYLKYPVKVLLKEYAEMGPKKARLLYDFLAVIFSALSLQVVLNYFDIDSTQTTNALFLIIGTIVINYILGIYTRYGASSSVIKFLLIFINLSVIFCS